MILTYYYYFLFQHLSIGFLKGVLLLPVLAFIDWFFEGGSLSRKELKF